MFSVQWVRGFAAPVFFLLGLAAASGSLRAQTPTEMPSHAAESIPFGGHHEWGLWAGYSGFSGPVWGYTRDVHYTTVDVRYSYRFVNSPHWNLRYAPEGTLLARLRETTANIVNANAPDSRYGAGVSPVGFQLVYFPKKRVQPFLQTAEGWVYYNDRVLSPQGSQFMFVIDFGAGVNLFTSPRYAVQVGYRYLHTSNANISVHNPGTDADVFYVGFSHFHTKGVR